MAEDLAALPLCRFGGCNRRALGLSGGCEEHGHALATKGVKKSPEFCAKTKAAIREYRAAHPDWARDLADMSRERMEEAWRLGGQQVRRLLAAREDFRPVRAAVRRKLGAQWGGNTPARATARGRPREYGGRSAKELLDELARLRQSNPKLGIRPLAARLSLTKRQLEYLIAVSQKSS